VAAARASMILYRVTLPQDGDCGVARKPAGWWPPKFGARELLSEWSAPTFIMEGQLVDLQPNHAGIKMVASRTRWTWLSPLERFSLYRNAKAHA
jgi:hypothetical protein